jgi:hypothetical protein
MEELAQAVGNARIRGEFGMDAATAGDQNTNGAGLFQRLDPALAHEEALSPLTQGIAQLLPALGSPNHCVALPDTNDVIRRFNRDTKWLATGVLGAVVSAALMLAVLVQDRHPRAVDLTEEAVQAGGDLVPNANSATLFKDVGLKGKKSTGEITSGQANSVDHAFAEISPTENPSSQMEAAASTLTAVVASNPEMNHTKALANANTWFPADRRHSMRVIRPKVPNVKYRSSLGLTFVDVKMRLIALWHKALMRSEKSRISTISLNWNRGER